MSTEAFELVKAIIEEGAYHEYVTKMDIEFVDQKSHAPIVEIKHPF